MIATNIIFYVIIIIINFSNQETAINVKYRYINPCTESDFIVEYSIRNNDMHLEYSAYANLIKINKYIVNDERHLLFENANVSSINRSFQLRRYNGELHAEGSVQIDFEKSIAKYRLVNDKKVKEGTIVLPDNWIPRMLHFDPSILYFASRLRTEMVGYEGILIEPLLGSYMEVKSAKYRIDKVEKRKYKLNNNEYDCDVYTILIQRERYEGTIMKSNYWKELFYIYDSKLIEYNHEGFIRLIIEE